MTISIRLDPETETALRRRLETEKIPLSAFVRAAIQEKLARGADEVSPYTLGDPLFGRYASGEADRSLHRKELLRELLHAKKVSINNFPPFAKGGLGHSRQASGIFILNQYFKSAPHNFSISHGTQ
ncbi:hypothetical protein G3480_22660 [Thiorhodococcus mannitoliphagus]|uniref:Ribbon-helix-helix protein, CopG family n=1 Tax=Thiorhodococcus mannitoliphagus TaxID=329406 RepID=A0A6P1E4W3_9GAMM|nr:hypothetical protein [Thiorhodococcus mannitoliphagus]NEX23064.1 hypothetical protein [Thiorhodococcus mannitoliphagus]